MYHAAKGTRSCQTCAAQPHEDFEEWAAEMQRQEHRKPLANHLLPKFATERLQEMLHLARQK